MTPPRKVSPGRGWRLLRKGEVVRKGDEYQYAAGHWLPCRGTVGLQISPALNGIRRRIRRAGKGKAS